jgi:hypothetical protein
MDRRPVACEQHEPRGNLARRFRDALGLAMGHAPKLSLRWFVSPDPSNGFGFGNILKRQASIREKLIADCWYGRGGAQGQ